MSRVDPMQPLILELNGAALMDGEPQPPLASKPSLRAVAPAAPVAGLPLQLRGIGKHYGAHQVLHSIDLDIAPGEFVAIVGRSGCGKSTLLRLLAQLEQPDAGHLQAAGWPGPGGAARRHPHHVPGRPPAALENGAGQHRPGLDRSRCQGPRPCGAGIGGPGRPRQRLAGRAVGRPAPARGLGPRPGACAPPAAAGRAAGRAGCADPHRDAPA